MRFLKSLVSAFLMYSKIPMPQIEWKEENRRYALCFFPLIGAVIGVIFLIWIFFSEKFFIGEILKSVVCVLIPVFITGGIHIDGFCDVTDAVSSYAPKEKKLEIMKDPHVGSFALIKLCCYFIFQAALFSEVKNVSSSIIIACGFILSRGLSAITAVSFKCAKNNGSLYSFVKPVHKKVTLSVLIFTITFICAAMLFSNPVTGICAIIGAIMSVVYYRVSAYKNFGGITGDTAGWFLQICEISILLWVVIGQKISEVIAL